MTLLSHRAGFTYNYALGENGWNIGYDANWAELDALIGMDFGIYSISGLVVKLLGGALANAGAAASAVAATSTVTLVASQTNYIQRDTAGTITSNTVSFSATLIPLYTVSTNATAATAYVSYRFTGSPFSQGARVMVPPGGTISLDQGADDQAIFNMRSSDITHGMTTLVPTDVFGNFQKRQASFGGLLIEGYVETGDSIGLQLQANVTDGNTTKSSSGLGGVLINSQKKSGTTVGAHAANENLAVVANNGTVLFIFDADGDLHVTRHVAIGALGVSHLANVGLTIQQGGEDVRILQLKSTDVNHGMTTLADTDTYLYAIKSSPTDGGCAWVGLSGGSFTIGFQFSGVAGAGDTSKSTSSRGPCAFDSTKKSGTSQAALGANENIAVFSTNGTTRFIFDADGDSHQDVGTLWTNFDIVRDIELLNVAAAHLTRADDPLRENFHGWLAKDRAVLEKHKLVTFNEDGHHFVNWSRMSMLFLGALRQLGAQVEYMREQLNLPEHPSLKCLPSV